MSLSKILDKFNNVYFSSGGIGDCLLLISNIYISNNKSFDDIGVVFFADNKENIIELLNIFGIKNKIVFQGNQGIYKYNEIINHKNFKSKCHYPDDGNFLEWYYNYEKYHKEFKKEFPEIRNIIENKNKSLGYLGGLDRDINNIAIGCFGSRKESFKIKHLNTEEFNKLLIKKTEENINNILLVFGSKQDKEEFKIDESIKNIHRIHDFRGITLFECMHLLNQCSEGIFNDTWYKTYCHFIGMRNITVINTEYNVEQFFDGRKKTEMIFGKGILKDPGNNIFLDNGWNFNRVDKKEYLI